MAAAEEPGWEAGVYKSKTFELVRSLRTCIAREQSEDTLPSHGKMESALASGQLLPKWRRQVVKWMHEVCDGFKFDFETCSIAVQYFDRFLGEVPIGVDKLQVSALVCIWTASKMHERSAVRCKDIEKYFSSFAEARECRVVELKLLVQGLQWRTAAFTPIAFARMLLHAFLPWGTAMEVLQVVKPLIRVVETDKEFLKLWPSEVGMAVLEVAHAQLGRTPHFGALLDTARSMVGQAHMPQRQPSAVMRLHHVLTSGGKVDATPASLPGSTPGHAGGSQRSPVEDPGAPAETAPLGRGLAPPLHPLNPATAGVQVDKPAPQASKAPPPPGPTAPPAVA